MNLTDAPEPLLIGGHKFRCKMKPFGKILNRLWLRRLALVSAASVFCLGLASAADKVSNREMVEILAGQLTDALSANQKKFVPEDAVRIENSISPFVKPTERIRDGKFVPMVTISEGFIALANQVSYARARNSSTKGYFDQFIQNLAKESGEQALTEPAELTDRTRWTLQLSNDQLTQFNQIVATVIAMDLAHHYLGHYQKYKSRLTNAQGQPIALNSLLTAEEWEDAAIAGALNALDCSIATDGIRTLFECIEKMPQRPAWTIFFMPESVDSRRLQKRLSKLEKGFFRGRR